jgi:hypothetical protein
VTCAFSQKSEPLSRLYMYIPAAPPHPYIEASVRLLLLLLDN